jgi:hypothetical protein
MQPPQPPRGPFPGSHPSGGPFGRGNLPGMGVGGPPLPAPTTAPSRGPGYPSAQMPVQQGSVVAEVPRGPSVRFQPLVHYFRRMRTGKLHRLVVKIEPEGGAPSAATLGATTQTPVTIQPIIPGAIITPTMSEVPLRSGGEAVFYVMPLALGKLPEARLELVITGKRFTNAMLPMRANSGWLPRLLLVLTVMATLVFLAVPFYGWEPYVSGNRSYYNEMAVQEYLKDRVRPLGYDVGDPPATPPADSGPKREEEQVARPPAAARAVKQEWDARDYLFALLYKAEPLTSNGYLWLCALQRTAMGPAYVFAFLLALTLVAWVFQKPASRKVQGAMLEMKV